MNLKEFAIRLHSVNEKSAIKAIISDFINTHTTTFNEAEIKKLMEQLSNSDFTSFGNKLGFCRNYCIEEHSKEENDSENDATYLNKLAEVCKLLTGLSEIYQRINIEREEERKTSAEAAAVSQQKDVLRELNNKIKGFKQDIESAKQEIKTANDSFNDKIFSLLINTVAILGIFVTIAFAGFGVASIISNIDLKTALISEEAFVKNLFFMLLTALLCYNLLLLLVYFIFKLSRPLLTKKQNGIFSLPSNNDFSQSINLTVFVWIDGVLGVLTLAAFISCLIFW